MKISYTVVEYDFLMFQYFNASQSKRINKKISNRTILFMIIFGILSIMFFIIKMTTPGIIYLVLALLIALFYPKYIIWRHKKHYASYIKEHYNTRFNQTENLEFTGSNLILDNEFGNSSIKLSKLNTVSETRDHFFIKVTNGSAIILPKSELDDEAIVKDKFVELGLTIEDHLDWSW